MQGLHRAADHPHAKPVGYSRNIAQASTSIQATRVALISATVQMSTQAQARSRAQTLACSAQGCNANGIVPRMLILATSSSSLTAAGRCGGNVISAQMAILMSGKQVLTKGPVAHHVLFVQTGRSVNITHWPQSSLTLQRSSVPEIRAQLMTIHLAVGRRCSGNASMDMNTRLPSIVGQATRVAVLNVMPPAMHHSPSRSTLC